MIRPLDFESINFSSSLGGTFSHRKVLSVSPPFQGESMFFGHCGRIQHCKHGKGKIHNVADGILYSSEHMDIMV